MDLWFNQIETQLDLHQITDDDKRYRLTSAALSGEVASDVRDLFLQPFRTHKYENLKGILIERRGLTTPEREKMGSDILSRFLRQLQKTTRFGTTAVVGKTVIRQAFIRQMPTSIHAHLATQADSVSLESLAKKRNYRRSHTAENRATKTPFVPNVQAKPFVPSNQSVSRQGFVKNNQPESCAFSLN